MYIEVALEGTDIVNRNIIGWIHNETARRRQRIQALIDIVPILIQGVNEAAASRGVTGKWFHTTAKVTFVSWNHWYTFYIAPDGTTTYEGNASDTAHDRLPALRWGASRAFEKEALKVLVGQLNDFQDGRVPATDAESEEE